MARISPDRFYELCRRRDALKAVLDNSLEALNTVNSACDEARIKWEEACHNLSRYVHECAGDLPGILRKKRSSIKRNAK